jgi:hypothetical protein
MPTKRPQLHAAAAELIRDHLVPRLQAQRAREWQLLDVLAARRLRATTTATAIENDLAKLLSTVATLLAARREDVMASFPRSRGRR